MAKGRSGRIIQEYSGSSTIHGVVQVGAAKSRKTRCFWALIALVCLGLMIWQIAILILKFLRYEKETAIVMEYDFRRFPAVTICTLNNYNRGEAMQIEKINNLMKAYEEALRKSKATNNTLTDTETTTTAAESPENVGQSPTTSITPSSARGTFENFCGMLAGNGTNLGCLGTENRRFEWTESTLSWYDAFDQCASGGGKLAHIDSMELLDALMVWKLQQSSYNLHPLIGAKALSPALTDWVWVDEKDDVTGIPLMNSFPDFSSLNRTAEDDDGEFVYLHLDNGSNATFSHKAQFPSKGLGYICEYSAPTTTTTTAATIQDITASAAVSLSNNNRTIDFTFKTENSNARTILAQAQEELAKIVSTLSSEEVDRISLHPSDVIRECAFGQETCHIDSDFQVIQDYQYGKCFMFNAEKNFSVWRAGQLYGLKLLLKTDVTEYMQITESAGVRILIHDQNVWPFPDSFGINVPLSSAVIFSVKAKSARRLPKPHGKCSRNHPTSYYNGKYSVEACLRSCSQKAVVEKCNCRDYRIPPPPNSSALPLCHVTLESHRCFENLNHNSSNCHCPLPCEETYFEAITSSSKWPYKLEETQWKDEISCSEDSECAVLMEVYMEELSNEVLVETPGYTLVDLISDIAGQVGFWSGISVISLVEVAFLVAQLMAPVGNERRRVTGHQKPFPPPPFPVY